MGSIVLLSTGQPSTNPCLVKKAIALAASGYRGTVLCSFWLSWAVKIDKKSLLKIHQSIGLK